MYMRRTYAKEAIDFLTLFAWGFLHQSFNTHTPAERASNSIRTYEPNIYSYYHPSHVYPNHQGHLHQDPNFHAKIHSHAMERVLPHSPGF